MKKGWKILGTCAFWLSWHALRVYLGGSKRSRIIVSSKGKGVLVKNWLGSNQWSLPGGGLHRGETAAKGVLRELQEETGIIADPGQLICLAKEQLAKEHGLTFIYTSFLLELPEPVAIKPRRVELTDAEWLPWSELLAGNQISQVARDILTAWFNP